MAKKQREKTPKQNRMLNWLLGEAGLFDDEARDYLESVCGKRYRRDMDFYDFRKAIDDLMGKLKKKPETAKPEIFERRERAEPCERRDKSDPPTPEQLIYIREMLESMGADHKARARWCKRQTGYVFPMNVGDAQKLIEALKSMNDRNYRFPEDTKKSSAPLNGEKNNAR